MLAEASQHIVAGPRSCANDALALRQPQEHVDACDRPDVGRDLIGVPWHARLRNEHHFNRRVNEQHRDRGERITGEPDHRDGGRRGRKGAHRLPTLSACPAYRRDTLVTTSTPSIASNTCSKPRDFHDLDAAKRIHTARTWLRALWTVWSVEVRVFSGAWRKPRMCGAFSFSGFRLLPSVGAWTSTSPADCAADADADQFSTRCRETAPEIHAAGRRGLCDQ